MKKLSFLLLAVIFVSVSVFNSCKPDPDDGQNPEFQMNDGINIYSEDVIHYMGDVFLGDSLIFFDASMPEELMPKVNEHIFIPVSDKTPYGVLANVKTVRKTDKIIVEIEPMSLDEAFEFLTIDESTPITTELEGVFDIDGNPMEFEVVDTTEIDLNDTIVNPMNNRGFTLFEFDENCIKIPVKIAKTESGNDKIEVSGIAYIGFHNFKFEIDNADGLKYLNLNATPYVKLGVQNKMATENVLEISQRVGQIHFKITVPTPAGIPIIFPVTLYVNAGFGIRGELSATLGLQYEYNCNCVAKFDNGQWIRNVTHGGTDKSPWVVSEFDVKGEIYSGFKLGLLVGLYSATSGIGFNLEPKLSLATQAQLSSEDLLKTNPNVDLSLKAGSELYCIAKLFGKKLPKLSVQFPDFTLWSQKMYLLPNITEFTAEGDKTSADISWKHDIIYFLSAIGLKTGTAVFESNGITEIASYKPSPSGNDVESYYYDVTATGLSTGETYYAAPFAYWNDYVWYGEMEEFTTEEGTCEPDGYIAGHGYVDLGLPSGVKWATCNVGASSPEDYGDYFAWGETSPKAEYTWENSVTFGDQMSDISGNAQYDAATANWGGSWRMPTNDEMQELVDHCEWEWTEVNGVNGSRVIGPNGSCIFLPAAGYRGGSSLNSGGGFGYYWSSTPLDDGGDGIAYYLGFDDGGGFVGWSGYRNYGLTVRPITE